MAYPSHNVDLFKRIARERLDDAGFLQKHGRGSAAVYLGGYVIECALKALILAAVPRDREEEVMGTFRGPGGHKYDYLQHQLLTAGGAPIPQNVRDDLVNVAGWQVARRYIPHAAMSETLSNR
ncbi:MAG: hypothetical protein M3552_11430 [Planctomycetota bacterium]|nr:hypothetical protein [Planctomycetota bacterium]